MQAQATQIIHAYKQAPWRVQRQYVGAFLLIVIGISMIAALYLQVTARAARAGREIQEMRVDKTGVLLPLFFKGNGLVTEPGPAFFKALANAGEAFVDLESGHEQVNGFRRNDFGGHRRQGRALREAVAQLGLPIAQRDAKRR